ncbi:hypothetical protein DQE80_15325, partial [Enterococcus sp. HPCN18]
RDRRNRVLRVHAGRIVADAGSRHPDWKRQRRTTGRSEIELQRVAIRRNDARRRHLVRAPIFSLGHAAGTVGPVQNPPTVEDDHTDGTRSRI